MLADMRIVGVLLLSAVISAATLCAQQTAPVTVSVTDISGAVVPHAHVKFVPNPNPAPPSETDAKGQYSTSLTPGSYEIFVIVPGFRVGRQCVDVTAKGSQTAVALYPGATGSPTVLSLGSLVVSVDQPDGSVRVPNPLEARDVDALPHITITVHNGHTNADETYSGVPLATLLAKQGVPTGKDLRGKALANYIIATGADGYKAVLALAEVDPDFHPGQVIIADALNGKPLDKDGPYKLIVTEDKHPARWVRNLISIEVKAAE
jgi:hypothetical protein